MFHSNWPPFDYCNRGYVALGLSNSSSTKNCINPTMKEGKKERKQERKQEQDRKKERKKIQVQLHASDGSSEVYGRMKHVLLWSSTCLEQETVLCKRVDQNNANLS